MTGTANPINVAGKMELLEMANLRPNRRPAGAFGLGRKPDIGARVSSRWPLMSARP